MRPPEHQRKQERTLGEQLGDTKPKFTEQDLDAFKYFDLLQPLLENAVYHGVEPRIEPSVVSISIYANATDDTVHAVLRNPFQEKNEHHSGNRMAVANIRERLQLHFDAEASLTSRVSGGVYEVHIVVPYVKSRDR